VPVLARACGFDSRLAHQLALTKKMQAKIPHFGAGFLHMKSKFKAIKNNFLAFKKSGA